MANHPHRHINRRRFLGVAAAMAAAPELARRSATPAYASAVGLPEDLVKKAKAEGELVPYEPFPTEQSKPMADAFTAEFGIPNKFFRAGQEALQARVEAEIRAGKVLADTISQSDLDVVESMLDRGLLDTEHRPLLWEQYPEKWRFPKINNIAFAILACNMIYNSDQVPAADAPNTWEDLVAEKWKGKVVVPSPEYAGTGFALLAEWVSRYGWDFIRSLKKNDAFVVQAVSDSDRRVISGQKLVGIANSHRASGLLGQNAPIKLVWSQKTPPVALSYVHVVFKNAPNPHAARLYRDYCLTPKMQSAQAKVGLWSAHPDAVQPANIPHFNEVSLAQLDYEYIRKNRRSLLEGWKDIMRG